MPENINEEERELIVPPFTKKDIVEIIKTAILDGTIASETQVIDDSSSYTLKIVNGAIVLVEDE